MLIYTSYFSRLRYLPKSIVPVSVSLWPPRGWSGLEYKSLAPSRDILAEYKANPQWPRYVRRFKAEILANLDPNEILTGLETLSGGRDIALTCFEKDASRCHRSLVAKWLSANGADVAGEWPER